jgi:CRP-like cAMP-binding protein
MISPSELELAAELSRPRKFAAGEVVFEEGELGDSLFVIMGGEVEIARKDASGQVKPILTLKAPEFFGEMSLVDKEFRSATVRARSDCMLLQLTAENFAAFRKHHRDAFVFIVMNIARVLSARLRDANARLSARL